MVARRPSGNAESPEDREATDIWPNCADNLLDGLRSYAYFFTCATGLNPCVIYQRERMYMPLVIHAW